MYRAAYAIRQEFLYAPPRASVPGFAIKPLLLLFVIFNFTFRDMQMRHGLRGETNATRKEIPSRLLVRFYFFSLSLFFSPFPFFLFIRREYGYTHPASGGFVAINCFLAGSTSEIERSTEIRIIERDDVYNTGIPIQFALDFMGIESLVGKTDGKSWTPV